jgi:hypothetical protein
MEDTVKHLESNLKVQLQSLEDQIRTTETNLIRLKELYLKTQGGLETLDIVSKSIEDSSLSVLSDL